MPRAGTRELVESWRARYLRASRNEKGQILDELVALTGYPRKSAIRLFRHGYPPQHLDRRGRPSVYTPHVRATLVQFRNGVDTLHLLRSSGHAPEDFGWRAPLVRITLVGTLVIVELQVPGKRTLQLSPTDEVSAPEHYPPVLRQDHPL